MYVCGQVVEILHVDKSHGSELVTHCDKVLLLLIPWETRLWLKGLSL